MPKRVRKSYFLKHFRQFLTFFLADVFLEKPRPNAVQDVENLRNGARNCWLTGHRSENRNWIFCFFLLISMGIGLTGCHYFKDQDPKSSQQFKSIDDLNNRRITLGVPMGARSDQVLSEQFDKATLKRYSDVADGILAVKSGKIDAFGFDRSVLSYAVDKNSDLMLFPDFGEYGPLVIGSSLKNKELITQVNKFIAQYRDDGTYDDMERRWIRGESSDMPDIPKPQQPDGTLIVGSDGKCEPMTFIGKDGKMTGFDIEFAQRLALFLNKKLEIVSPTWDGLILGTTNGKIDLLIANLNRREDLEKSLSFSDEYVQSEIVLVVRKDRLSWDKSNDQESEDENREISDSKMNELENQELEDRKRENAEGICRPDQMISESLVIRPKKEAFDQMMNHARIALTVGSILEGIARKEYPESNILPFDTYPDLVPALLNDRADVAYSSYSSMFTFIQKNKEPLRCIEAVDQFDDVGIAFRKESVKENEWANDRLVAYEKSGFLNQLGKKWFVAPEKYPPLYRQTVSKNAPVWKIAVSPDREPMIFIRNGEVDGFDAELIRRIGDDLGIRMEFSQMKFASLIPDLLSGKSDAAISSLSITPERQQKVLFSRPYLRNSYLALVRQDFADRFFSDQPLSQSANPVGEFDSLDELAGLKVAVLSGSIFDQILQNHIPTAIPCYYPDLASMIAALESGKISAFLVDSPILRLILKRHPHLIGIKERLVDYNYGYALTKMETELTAELSEFIQARFADGTMEKLEKKWGEGDEAEKIMPPYKNDGSKRKIRYGYLVDQEPFCYRKSNQPFGLEIELALMFAESQGYSLEFIPLTHDSILASVTLGKADIVSGCLTITEERKRSLLFSEPYHWGGANAVVRIKETTKRANEPQSLGFFSELQESFHRTLLLENRWKLILSGLGMTLILTGFSALFGTLLAFPLCVMRRAKNRFLAGLAALMIYLVRGTPIVVFLMVLYYVVFGNVNVNAIIIAIIGFSINFAAYFSEMLRSSIDAIDRGEIEAAKALGFSRWGVFQNLILPQAIRYVMPMYKGEIVALLKMTAIVGYIAVEDLTKASDIIRSRTYEAFFPLILTTIIYLLIAWILIQLLSLIEFRVDPRFRSRIPKGVTKR